MEPQFILHIILSLGRFETEVGLAMQRMICNYLRYYTPIGTDDDKDSLKWYSISLLWRFIEGQLVHFPNLFRELDIFIINAAHIFDDVIINDSIQITDIPPVL